MKKLAVIRKVAKTPCYCCNGMGLLEIPKIQFILAGNIKFCQYKKPLIEVKKFVRKYLPHFICKVCNGTGKYRETHYIISDGKNAIDADFIK
jgi:hypothetical protein